MVYVQVNTGWHAECCMEKLKNNDISLIKTITDDYAWAI